MPYKYDWYVEGQVLHIEVWGDQTLEELKEANEVMVQQLDSGTGRFVHLVINDENLKSIPISLTELRKTFKYSRHPKLGWVVMVGSQNRDFTGYIVVMLAKLARARYIRFDTFDEVKEHLKKVDHTINWDIENTNL